MFKKLREARRQKALGAGYQIIVNVEKLETRVAQLRESKLVDYTIERTGDENNVGSIFKGRVKNIEPGLKAMFVDIGTEKNAFLHFWDAMGIARHSRRLWPRRRQSLRLYPFQIGDFILL